MSGEKEFPFAQKRQCRSCKAEITVTRETWRGKEVWMLYHAIPKCDWFKQVEASKTQAAEAERIRKGGAK